jgi:hypothetical protein
MNYRFIVLLVLAACLSPLLAAQEMTPRAYWPAPKGTQVMTLGLAYTDGDIVPDPSLPVQGLDSEITTALFGYLRTINFFGRSANIILDLPYSDGTTTADHPELGRLERDYNGIGDLGITLQVNLVGAPTMDAAGFAELRRDPRPMIGASLRVVAPTGDYDNDRIANVGANRWAVKPELGVILPLTPKWLFEFEVGAWLFEDNDDFLVGRTREQDPIYSVEAHLVRRFAPGFWLSLDATGYRGGRSTFEGRRLDDLQRDSKLGTTLVYPFAKGRVLKFSYTNGSVNNSDENFNIYTLSYQHLF